MMSDSRERDGRMENEDIYYNYVKSNLVDYFASLASIASSRFLSDSFSDLRTTISALFDLTMVASSLIASITGAMRCPYSTFLYVFLESGSVYSHTASGNIFSTSWAMSPRSFLSSFFHLK